MGKLAISGGVPVVEKGIASMPWPPVSEDTADKLRELYLSGNWSFNCQAEKDFAQAFADYHGAKYGIFMANGTVTLECALLACGIKSGDEVIVPALTWMATAMAVKYAGGIPVFVDIDPETLCMDHEKLEEAITPKTKAVIPVHLYGSMADLEKIREITDRHDLFLIEDCAHMQGGVWNGKGVGSRGHVGSFSFQQSKTLSSGEGGICITNDEALAEKIYRIKHIGYSDGAGQGKADSGPEKGLVCHNYRATGFQAVILSSQLENLPALIDRYNDNAAIIENTLADIEGVRVQRRGRLADPQGYYGLGIIFDREPLNGIALDNIIKAFWAEGLNLVGNYGPVYQHMLFNLSEDEYRIAGDSCPVAEGSVVKRTRVLQHQYLGCDESTAKQIAEIIAKVAINYKELK